MQIFKNKQYTPYTWDTPLKSFINLIELQSWKECTKCFFKKLHFWERQHGQSGRSSQNICKNHLRLSTSKTYECAEYVQKDLVFRADNSLSGLKWSIQGPDWSEVIYDVMWLSDDLDYDIVFGFRFEKGWGQPLVSTAVTHDLGPTSWTFGCLFVDEFSRWCVKNGVENERLE